MRDAVFVVFRRPTWDASRATAFDALDAGVGWGEVRGATFVVFRRPTWDASRAAAFDALDAGVGLVAAWRPAGALGAGGGAAAAGALGAGGASPGATTRGGGWLP